jgi:hypothetical protein
VGLIRKSLHVASLGAVAPNSRKQRVALQQLAALQGKSPEEVRRVGGRLQHSPAPVPPGPGERTEAEREARRSAYPLWRQADELRAAGAKDGDAARYGAYAVIPPAPVGYRAERWRQKYLASHPAIAERLFPDGIPQVPE